MTLTFLKQAVPAIAAAVILAQPVFGQESDVVSMPEDYGTIQQCVANQAVPRLPETWKATALLTPFDAKELLIAQVQAIPDIMRVTTKGLESGARDDFLVAGDTTYRLLADGAGNTSCVPVWKEEWVAPSPELLWGKGCSCEGIGSVTGVEAEAWKCPVPKEPASGPDHRRATAAEELFDWYWFTTADKPADREPLRILTSREGNYYHIPVLGDAALANLATVERPLDAGAARTLRDLAAACEVDKPAPVAVPDPLIKGVDFAGCRGFMPPTWPETAYSDGALYAIGGDYTRIEVYYEYDKLREVSKIYYQDGRVLDTYLTEDTTWEILWPKPDGADDGPQCQIGLKNVGIWHPDWAARDGCSCKAAIAPHPRLNPTDETVHAMSCFFGDNAYIQSWYSESGRPHLFYETNAPDLDLIDYSRWVPNAKISPEVFDREPTYCMTPSRTKVKIDEPFCADCHGGQIGYD